MQILVVEDDRGMAELLRQGLAEEGHGVVLAPTGPDGLSIASASLFDVIVLDVMLPGLDGFTLAKRLRDLGNQTPILFLTARDALSERVKGLDLGGDDYVTKPFAFEELLARLRALGRRGPIPTPVRMQVADLFLDTSSREVRRAGRAVYLTPKEFSLLELLMRRAGQVVPRDVILSRVWGYDSEIESNTLEAFVKLLRGKVDQGFSRKLIHTVRGVGYSLRESEE